MAKSDKPAAGNRTQHISDCSTAGGRGLMPSRIMAITPLRLLAGATLVPGGNDRGREQAIRAQSPWPAFEYFFLYARSRRH